MTIRFKQRELVAVGISVAAGCRPCTDYHLKAARKAGASDEEIKASIADAIAVRTSAAGLMNDYARSGLAGEAPAGDPAPPGEIDRVRILVSLGAALAVNCVPSLEKYLAAAEGADIAKLATFIRGKAISHVERLAAQEEAEAA